MNNIVQIIVGAEEEAILETLDKLQEEAIIEEAGDSDSSSTTSSSIANENKEPNKVPKEVRPDLATEVW